MKYVFASDKWFAALHAIICERANMAVTTHPGFSYSICEVFTDVPPELATLDGARTAWHATVRGADVTFELEDSDAVDFRAIGEYASILPIARVDTLGQADRVAKLQEMVQAVVADGKLTMVGTALGNDGPLGSLHDAIAKLTA